MPGVKFTSVECTSDVVSFDAVKLKLLCTVTSTLGTIRLLVPRWACHCVCDRYKCVTWRTTCVLLLGARRHRDAAWKLVDVSKRTPKQNCFSALSIRRMALLWSHSMCNRLGGRLQTNSLSLTPRHALGIHTPSVKTRVNAISQWHNCA